MPGWGTSFTRDASIGAWIGCAREIVSWASADEDVAAPQHSSIMVKGTACEIGNVLHCIIAGHYKDSSSIQHVWGLSFLSSSAMKIRPGMHSQLLVDQKKALTA